MKLGIVLMKSNPHDGDSASDWEETLILPIP